MKNWYIPFFGVIFPILLSQLIGRTALSNGIPEKVKPFVYSEAFFSFATIIPLCVILLGHASMQSQDIEKGVPQRLRLFGISLEKQLSVRLITLLLVFIVSIIIFSVQYTLSFRIHSPSFGALLIVIVIFMILAVSLFMLAHAIALFLRKFEPAYGVTMGLYFFFMIIGGAMGLRPSQFPQALKFVAQAFPFYHMAELSKIFYQSINLAPMVQSLLFFFVLSLSLLLLALKQSKNNFKKA